MGPADGESQPYIMYQEFQNLMNALCEDIQSFCSTVLGHVTPGYGAPSIQLNQAAAALKAAMDDRKGQVPSVQSERIFGE